MATMEEIGQETATQLLGLCSAAGQITTGSAEEQLQCLSHAQTCAMNCRKDFGGAWDSEKCKNTTVADLSHMDGPKVTCQHLGMVTNGKQILMDYGGFNPDYTINYDSEPGIIKGQLDQVMAMLQEMQQKAAARGAAPM